LDGELWRIAAIVEGEKTRKKGYKKKKEGTGCVPSFGLQAVGS
jgi:hypothetical protein